MTAVASKAAAIRELALMLRVLAFALGWARSINAFKQESEIPDDDPTADGYLPLQHKKQRGRPPSQSTLHMQAMKGSRPAYAGPKTPRHSDLLKALQHYWQVLRANQGLQSKTVSDEFALRVIAMDEERLEALISGSLLSAERLALHSEILKKLEAMKIAVSGNARRSGQKVSAKTQQSLIEKDAPEILCRLIAGQISYKVAQRLLGEKRLPIPAERSLRRMVRSKTGQEPAPK